MRTPIATSIDTLDLPPVAEARAMLALWRQLAPPDHRVGMVARDLERLQVLMVGRSYLPPILGTGAWWVAELPTDEERAPSVPTDPEQPVLAVHRPVLRVAIWAYASTPGHLETMRAFLAPPAPAHTLPAEFDDGPGWSALTWPDHARAMLMLHRLAAAQMPGVLNEGHRA